MLPCIMRMVIVGSRVYGFLMQEENILVISRCKRGLLSGARRSRLQRRPKKDMTITHSKKVRQQGSNSTRNYTTDLNNLMSGHVLQYVGKDDDGKDKLVTFTNDTKIVFTGTDKNLITTNAIQGGRYISLVSSLYKPYRKTTTIDGRPTVEADYKCCLPSIMFGRLKVDLLALEHDLSMYQMK